MEKTCARILLLGKTGVGKSSFVNYFLGKDVAVTGIGKPVTQELKEFEIEHNGLYLNVTDSKGLEVENSEKIKEDIINNVVARNGNDNIFEWYHTIFYCISVTNARIENYELEFLKELKGKISQNIHIILTNCDDPEKAKAQINGMREKLNRELGENTHIYEVCSVEITKRGGRKVMPHGKEEIIKGVFDLLWNDICWKVAEDFTKNIIRPQLAYFLKQKKKEIDELIEKNVSAFKTIKAALNDVDIEECLEEISEKYNREYEDKIADFGKQLNEKLKEVREFYSAYYDVVLEGQDIAEDISFDFQCELFDLEDVFEKSEFKKISDILENEEIGFKELFRVGKALLQLKKHIQELVDNSYNLICEKVEKFDFKTKIYDEIYSIRVPKKEN